MSQSSVPFEMASDAVMKPIEDMQSLMGEMARQAGLSSPLMVHPAAVAAAATALGFGAASHMAGLMIGSWQGAMEASKRMGLPVEAFDMTAGFKALDGERNAAVGETVETTARRAGEATRDVAAEPAAPAEEPQASLRRAEAMTAETVATVADVVEKAARTAIKAAEPVEKATLAAKSIAAKPAQPAAKAAEPVAKAATAAKAADAGKPVAMAKPERPDDLKQIAGIGPKLEEVLNRLGIWSFGQIAGWGKGEVTWVDDYLQAHGRIGRDGWIDQAKALAKK